MTRYISGFLDFDTDDEDLVCNSDLMSLTSTQASGATVTGMAFDSELGMSFPDTSSENRIEWSGVALSSKKPQTMLENGGHMTFEVSSKFLATALHLSGIDWFLFYGVGANAVTSSVQHYDNAGGGQILINTADGLHGRLRYQPIGNDYTRVDVSWNGTTMDVYFDKAHCLRFAQELGGEFTSFSTWLSLSDYWGTKKSEPDIYWKNLQVVARPLSFNTAYNLGVVNWYGDSFPTRGTYPNDWDINGLVGLVDSPDGGVGAASDPPQQSDVTPNNAGMIVVADAKLKENGFGAAFGQHFYWSVDGWGVDTSNKLKTRIDTSLVATLYNIPDVAIICTGTNDAAGVGTLDAAWKAVYQTSIDALIAANPNVKIIVLTQTTRNNRVSGDSYESRIDTVNTLIAELANDNSEVHLLDVFTLLGGHNAPSSDFVAADGIHLSPIANRKYGEWVAQKVMSII